MKIKINGLDELREFGVKIGKNLKGGEVILLRGDMGAGKTHLTKFIGEGMGIDEYITSPTFALLNIYEGRVPLYHFDTYRLEDGVDLDLLGFDEYIYSDTGVSIIEWPERIEGLLPDDTLDIFIETTGKNTRDIKIKCPKSLERLVKE